MSFAAINYDFSQLPKVRSHAQLGRLGGTCSWYDPTSFGDCATMAIQAGTELANMKNAILDLANAWAAGIQDIQTWPDSQDKSDALAQAQQGFSDAQGLVSQYTDAQNDFNSKVAILRAVGLAGLWKDSGGTAGLWDGRLQGLGVVPFAWAVLGATTFAVGALVYWGIQKAQSVKLGYEANSNYYNILAQYNQDCGQMLRSGQDCSGLTKPSSPSVFDGDMSTYLLIGGIAVLALMLMKR